MAKIPKLHRVWLAKAFARAQMECWEYNRHLPFTIDLDFVLALWDKQEGRCAITGVPMTHVFGHLDAASIDRIDSKLGYTPSNVQLICQWVNKAKGAHTNDEMIAALDRLYEYYQPSVI
jgi:hypothetical protein